MNYTTNYELKKPAGTDFYDIGNENDNMDILDRVIKELDDDFTALETRVDTLAGNLTALTTRVATAESSVASMNARVTAAENNVAGLKTRMTTAENNIAAITTRSHNRWVVHGENSSGDSDVITCTAWIKNGVCCVEIDHGIAGGSVAAGYWEPDEPNSFPWPANQVKISYAYVTGSRQTYMTARIDPTAKKIYHAGLCGNTLRFIYPL